jgi:hypothetical protein
MNICMKDSQPKPTRPILEFRVHGQTISGDTSSRTVRVSYQANAGITAADTEIYESCVFFWIGPALRLGLGLCTAVFTAVISESAWLVRRTGQEVYLDLRQRSPARIRSDWWSPHSSANGGLMSRHLVSFAARTSFRPVVACFGRLVVNKQSNC